MTENQIQKCPVCGLKVSGEVGTKDFPLKRLDLCKKCQICGFVVPFLGVGTFIFALVVSLLNKYFEWGLSDRSLLTLQGISFDIAGVCFLFGRLERALIAAGLIQGESNQVEEALPCHVWQTRLGWILVLVGFVFQAYVQFI